MRFIGSFFYKVNNLINYFFCSPLRGGVREGLFSVFPHRRHLLQRLALGLGHELPYEDGCYDAEDAIETVGEPMSEVIAFRQVHVEHRHERAGNDEVEYPLECHSDGHSSTTDGVGEYLGNEHPTDGTP